MDKITKIVCPCCNREIEITISKSGKITALFCCDNGIEFGQIPFIQKEGGE